MSERRVSEIVGVLRQVRDHWHEQGLYGDVEMGAAAELIEQQQAAIRRVQDVCEDKYVGPSTTYGEGFQNGYNDALYRVLRALNGLCPICSGPIRETVGLVCQTCGTDYGDSDE